MTDDRLQDLIAAARHGYRVPPAPPLDAIWARIEHEHFDAPHAPHDVAPQIDEIAMLPIRRWRWAPAVGVAATLLIGVGIGRVSAPRVERTPIPAVAAVAAEPLQRTASDYLDETAALLASLPRVTGTQRSVGDVRFVAQASQLLGTTRLLLDSPAASDPRMRNLLEDLELVLAQVARLRPVPRADELTFIAEAMDERDVVPRLRTVAASLSASGY